MRARLGAVWLCFVLSIIGTTACLSAHPLGNFTINHLAEITPQRGALHARYVLDIAEIPTFQIMRASSVSATWNASQLTSWATSEVPTVTRGLHVSVDGDPVAMALNGVSARLRPGAGGLPTLYWVADFTLPIAAAAHHIIVDDSVYSNRRIGWKDIIVSPQSEPTHELTAYPSALIASPRRIAGVTFNVSAHGRVNAIVARADDQPDFSGSTSIVRSNALSDMFSSANRTPLFILLTMLVAFGLGALHAIEPGHGKALLAFTLVGSRATVKQAAILAASLTFAHTIGVLILGAVLFFAAGFVSESIYPWITLLSGIAVVLIGARNLTRYLRTRRARGASVDGHDHGHDHRHAHAHDSSGAHSHEIDGAHSHAIAGDEPIDFRGAVVAAMSGGIAPCPAALVVMLAALRLHQIAYGMVLIVIFSLGLAAILTGLGIAVVHGSGLITRSAKFDRLVVAGPLISAALISIVGAVMVGQGFAAQGIREPAWLLAGFVVAGIAAYALMTSGLSLKFAAAVAADEAPNGLGWKPQNATPTLRRVDSLMEQQP